MNRKTLGRILLAMVISTGLVSAARAQAIHALSAQDAIELAKKNNINIKTAMTNLYIQEQTNKEVTALALPKITGSGSTTDYFSIPITLVPGEFTGHPGTYVPIAFQQKYIASAGVSLTQTVFDGSVFVGLKARTAILDYARKGVDLSVEQISVEVYKTYYQLAVSKTQIDLQDSNVARAAKLLHDTKVMNENGFAEKLDLDKAAVQLTNLQTARNNTATNIVNGFTLLKFLIGIPSSDSIVLTTEFTEEALLGGVPMDTSYSYKNRYDYQALDLQRQLNEYDVRRYKAAYYPVLNLNGYYGKNTASNTYDVFAKSGTWFTTSYIGLSLNVPIFEGLAKDARLKKAKLTANLTTEQIENLKLNISHEVAIARNNFINAIGTMTAQKNNMQTADRVYEQTKKKFESGLSSNTDLSNAQQDLILAQANYVNALYNAVLAKIDFLKAIGRI